MVKYTRLNEAKNSSSISELELLMIHIKSIARYYLSNNHTSVLINY